MVLAEIDPAGTLQSWLGRLDVLAWVLVGAAIALVWLTWRGVVGRTRLGTIDVEPIKTDEGTTLTPVAAAAELQRELALSGLRPPGGVPAGSPITKLVSAVESAPIDQVKWLAALIGLLPIPPASVSFTVTCTLRADGKRRRGCGLTYKIVDSGSGTCVKLDTEWHANARGAIHAAANAIYRAICEHASDAVPVWARWSDPQALVRYRAGLACEDKPGAGVAERYAAAAGHFLAASELDPDNMIVRLRHGNCLERLAGCRRLDEPERIARWIEALNVYAAVQARHSAICESRYRMSVVLGLVADHFDAKDEASIRALGVLLRSLEPTSDPVDEGNLDDLRNRLRAAAKRESKAAWQRLRPGWTIVHERRLRHGFEPTGKDRRQLRKALAMSYMCLRVRRDWHAGQEIRWGIRALPRVCWRWLVYWRYLRFRGPTAGWQAHYNAAAFYALMPEASMLDDQTLPGHRLRAQAFKHLLRAIDDPEHTLRCAYVRDEDADLKVLRELERHERDPAEAAPGARVSTGRQRELRLERLRWRRDVVRRLCGPEAILHYQRWAGGSDAWLAEIDGEALARTLRHARRPVRAALSDEYGAVFRIPIHDGSKPLSFRLVNGGDPDGLVRDFVPAKYPALEVWLVGDDRRIFEQRAEAEAALAAINDRRMERPEP